MSHAAIMKCERREAVRHADASPRINLSQDRQK
jgi:hypothetical protein